MNAKILVVEDEPILRETLAYNLTHQGYAVDLAADGKSALDKFRLNPSDLVLLDLMIPVIDGMEVCRILRRESNIPIVMLTARNEEFDRVMGLEIGADDYMTKPFSMRELMARVKAQLRRVQIDHTEAASRQASSSDTQIIMFGNLQIDFNRYEARLDKQALALKPKEFDLLLFLARNRGQALSREIILERVWGWDFVGGTRTVDVHISWLREKIEPDPGQPSRIITVRGVGYRFEG